MKLVGKGCGLGAKGTASARPPPDQASATPLPLSWRAPVQFQSLRRGRLTFSSRSKSSCTPYHPPVQEWACEMIHNKGWRKKKWFAGLSENFWKPTPPCLPGYVQWALGPRATQSREFHKNRAGAPKSLPKLYGPPILWARVAGSLLLAARAS